MEIYTHDEFKEMKKILKINNRDIAELLNCTEQNIRNHSNPKKKLGKIPISMLFIYRKLKKPLN